MGRTSRLYNNYEVVIVFVVVVLERSEGRQTQLSRAAQLTLTAEVPGVRDGTLPRPFACAACLWARSSGCHASRLPVRETGVIIAPVCGAMGDLHEVPSYSSEHGWHTFVSH